MLCALSVALTHQDARELELKEQLLRNKVVSSLSR